jgi:hypothetical protein
MVVPNEIREARQKKTAEVFTPPKLVSEMLDKLPKEVWQENKTFCDPACGNGEFLVWILIRKIENGHNPLAALKTIYGVDIKKDNIVECRARLLKIIEAHEPLTEQHIEVIARNVVRWNALTYSFNFRKPKKSTVKELIKSILFKNGLKDVPFPGTP